MTYLLRNRVLHVHVHGMGEFSSFWMFSFITANSHKSYNTHPNPLYNPLPVPISRRSLQVRILRLINICGAFKTVPAVPAHCALVLSKRSEKYKEIVFPPSLCIVTGYLKA